MPIYDTLDLTAADYDAYWEHVEEYTANWQSFINDQVFATGIPLPYWNLEFLTQFTFHPHAMLVVMDVFYNNME